MMNVLRRKKKLSDMFMFSFFSTTYSTTKLAEKDILQWTQLKMFTTFRVQSILQKRFYYCQQTLLQKNALVESTSLTTDQVSCCLPELKKRSSVVRILNRLTANKKISQCHRNWINIICKMTRSGLKVCVQRIKTIHFNSTFTIFIYLFLDRQLQC